MSVCMSTSAKCLPRAQARFLASRRTPPTPLWLKNSNSKGRWNSSRAGNPGGKLEAGVGKRVSKGWTTFSVLGLMAGTAFVAHGFAKYQAEARELRMRDYSSPEKWMKPKYASRKDMEDVSVPETLLILQSWGPSLAIGDTWTAIAVCLSPWVGWLGQLELPFQSLSNHYALPS